MITSGGKSSSPNLASSTCIWIIPVLPQSAGNGFRVEGGEPTMQGIVQSTGAWSNYRKIPVGTIELPQGRNYLSIKYDGDKTTLHCLICVPCSLVPAKSTTKLIGRGCRTRTSKTESRKSLRKYSTTNNPPSNGRRSSPNILDNPRRLFPRWRRICGRTLRKNTGGFLGSGESRSPPANEMTPIECVQFSKLAADGRTANA